MFVVETTYYATMSGMMDASIEAVRAALDRIPGGDSARVGLVTFDSEVHFYDVMVGVLRVYCVFSHR